jgi:hypothetical protein
MLVHFQDILDAYLVPFALGVPLAILLFLLVSRRDTDDTRAPRQPAAPPAPAVPAQRAAAVPAPMAVPQPPVSWAPPHGPSCASCSKAQATRSCWPKMASRRSS